MNCLLLRIAASQVKLSSIKTIYPNSKYLNILVRDSNEIWHQFVIEIIKFKGFYNYSQGRFIHKWGSFYYKLLFVSTIMWADFYKF